MMKTLLGAALCGLAAAMSTVQASTLFPHVPLVMWSRRSIFVGPNAYLSSEMDEAAVASAVERVLAHDASADKEGVLSTQASSTPHAELMCVFLLPSLASEDVFQLSSGAGSFVQSAVQSSVSSVVIPHTTRTKPLLPELTNAQPHIVGVQDLDVFLASAEGETLFSNGKADLLVVQLPESMSLPDVDAAIQAASSSLNAATGGKTDFAFTGNDANSLEIQDPLARRRLAAQVKAKNTDATTETAILCEAGYLVGYSTAGKAFCFSHFVSITPDIMAGLLFGLLFIFLAYIGLGVLHQIQTPQRYPSHGAPRGKEF
ncbi:hypothetical protein PHYPSEUDO_011318 [Phytophthora pseudosyringae]|uniref:Protein BIG1 n=1 Tax=Phytophthora pseudosyringae TaxID=221518 RepID=A0A8T1WBK1_9STRA|nr:hypothetical protein PHYPSEUDO_011318 [Phytophthora pseudosyringae]